MKEAAAAFGVPLYQKRVQSNGRKSSCSRRQQDIIDDVLRAVSQANACVPGSAAERDERRRQSRLAELLQLSDVYRARSDIPLLAAATMSGIEPLREDVLLYECPEDLRIAVTCEYRQRAGRLPELDTTDIIEQRAAQYLQSALHRRHKSDPSGEQLSMEEIAAWNAAWEEASEGGAMAWPEDPVLILARKFLKSHGNLDAQKHGVYATKVLTEDEREEDRLARDLDVVRRARLGDVREHLRRRWKKLSVGATLLRRT